MRSTNAAGKPTATTVGGTGRYMHATTYVGPSTGGFVAHTTRAAMMTNLTRDPTNDTRAGASDTCMEADDPR